MMNVRVSMRARERFLSLPNGGKILSHLYKFAYQANSAKEIIEYIEKIEGIEGAIGTSIHNCEVLFSSNQACLFYLDTGETYTRTFTVQRYRNSPNIMIDFRSRGAWAESHMRRGKKVYA